MVKAVHEITRNHTKPESHVMKSSRNATNELLFFRAVSCDFVDGFLQRRAKASPPDQKTANPVLRHLPDSFPAS
jgi:hypothetical protein